MKKSQVLTYSLLLVIISQSCFYEKVSPATDCESIDISFQATISPILQNNCAINDCHNGNQFPDLRQFNEIQQNSQRIKTQVVNRTMPPDNSLTQDQINAIACWVDNGTPVDN